MKTAFNVIHAPNGLQAAVTAQKTERVSANIATWTYMCLDATLAADLPKRCVATSFELACACAFECMQLICQEPRVCDTVFFYVVCVCLNTNCDVSVCIYVGACMCM